MSNCILILTRRCNWFMEKLVYDLDLNYIVKILEKLSFKLNEAILCGMIASSTVSLSIYNMQHSEGGGFQTDQDRLSSE